MGSGRAPALPQGPVAQVRRGAFVTLTVDGALRGCIGRIASDLPLPALVRDMAVAAGRDDPRFAPLDSGELPALRIEISVLAEPAVLDPVDPGRVEIGRDGLIVRRGNATALLLPQVAAEHGWGPEAFLAATCRKAGVGPDAWRDGKTEVLIFQADVFGE